MRNTHPRPTAALASTALVLALAMLGSPLRGQSSFHGTEWSAPLNLGPEINSAFEDTSPHLSSDGLSLYFSSTRPGGQGGEDLWVARRPGRHEPWGPVVNLGATLNSPTNDRAPSLSLNLRVLFFATDRPGGAGGFDIWVSWRPDPGDDFGWQPPVNLGTGINTAATDAGPSFLEIGDHRSPRTAIPQLYFASSRPGGLGGLDLYLGSVPGGWAGPATLVTELNTAQADLSPSLRRDGLEIVFASGRPGGSGNFDLWYAARPSVHKPWSPPVNLGPHLNTDGLEVFPSLSFDAETLLFQSARPGGFGGSDLYVSTR